MRHVLALAAAGAVCLTLVPGAAGADCDTLDGPVPEDVFSNIEEIRHACVELPQIAQLMQILRDEDNLHMDSLPLTVGEARRFLMHRLNGEFTKENIY